MSEQARPSTATILGIETSCDETAAAIVRTSAGSSEILADVIHSQTADHTPFGGVVPEIAARAHAELADTTVAQALDAAGLELEEIDAIAATCGPGLIGGVLVGMMTGKALAMTANKPFLPINHLEGHALSPRLAAACPFPYLLLLVSGGHCQLLEVLGLGDYRRLGSTIDDAAGEAFDKIARQMRLGFPGGPAVERLARKGDAGAVPLPRPLLDRPGLDFSFAGLKTAAARAIDAETLTDQRKADIAASFQAAAAEVLATKTARALAAFGAKHASPRLVVAGGVAANKMIRSALQSVADEHGAELICPPLRHCTDNAAMIALAGAEHFMSGAMSDLSARARPRWPLDEASAEAEPVYGKGKRGAKV